MSVLLPSSVALLRGVRALRPMFSNMIAAELFAAAHSLGELSVLPTTDGAYVVLDRSAPNGRCVRARCATVAQAHAELERLAKTSEERANPAASLSPAESSAEPAIVSASQKHLGGVAATRDRSGELKRREHYPRPHGNTAPAVTAGETALPRARASATPASSRRVAAPAELFPGIETRAGTTSKVTRKGVET